MSIVTSIHDSAESSAQKEQALMDRLTEAFRDSVVNDLKKAETYHFRQDLGAVMKPATNYEALPAISAVPGAIFTSDVIMRDAMANRYRELNRIPMPDGKARYLVDTSWSAPVSIQAFDIFMRYFCDPKASDGRMEKTKWKLTKVPDGPNGSGRTLDYTLGCGYIEGGQIETRHSMLGGNKDTSAEALQVIGLPARPGDLFFAPTTYPVTPTARPGESNVNPLSEVYYGAFAQSLNFLLGSAPSNGATMEGQAKIARQMLLSTPFAILFSERSGTMGPGVAESLATVLATKLSGSIDEMMEQRISEIRNRNTVSIAEYMDIMMYHVPTSPGYYRYIMNELTPEQLQREEVWLTAMQTALNYQRNRWLEILAALEAVR